VFRLRGQSTHRIIHNRRPELSQFAARLTGHPFGERGSGRDRRGAPAHLEPHFHRDLSVEARAEPQDVPASRIRDLDRHCRRREFAHVPRILKVIEKWVGIHVCSNIGMLQVVAAVLERDGRVLIAQRKPGQSHALQWEFPGGKVEPGETPDAAMARELHEELGIADARGREIGRYVFSYPGRATIELLFIRVDAWSGEPDNLVFHDLRWELPRRLVEYDFLEGDRDFLRTYTGRMPSVKTVDPSENEFLKALESKSGKPSPFFRVMANRPEALKNFVPFYGSVAGPGSVERRTKELVYLTVSYTNECAFCSWAHEASGRKAGITDDQLKILKAGGEEGFSDAELAAIRYARELTMTANGTKSRDALKAHYNDEQVVELTMLAAIANFTNRFNNGLAIFPDA